MTGVASTVGSFGKKRKVSSLFRNGLGKVLLESCTRCFSHGNIQVYSFPCVFLEGYMVL